jgi:hypothetical protein
MQIVIHVMLNAKSHGSLRELIIDDLEKIAWEDDQGRPLNLDVLSEKKQGRPSGWAKIKAKGVTGALNISWDAHSKTLTARAVGRGGNKPTDLVGRFLNYLLWQRHKKITSVVIRTI